MIFICNRQNLTFQTVPEQMLLIIQCLSSTLHITNSIAVGLCEPIHVCAWD